MERSYFDTSRLSFVSCENETNSVVDDYSLNWNRYSFNYFRKSRYSKSLKKYLDREMKEGSSSKKIIHAHNLWNYIPYISYIKSVEYM